MASCAPPQGAIFVKKVKKDKMFFVSNKLGLSEEDLIERPHGMLPELDYRKELKQLIKEYKKIRNSIKHQSKQKPHKWCNYDYATRTFTINQNNGQPLALTFRENKKGVISGQTILFEVGYELWKETNQDSFERQYILEQCLEKVKKYGVNIDVTSEWLKDTRINLISTVRHSRIKHLIRVFDYVKRTPNVYYFSINSSKVKELTP